MWRNTTLNGLDEALTELNRAIEALPDSSTKKGLISRFGKLHRVRHELDHPQSASARFVPILIGGAAMMAIMAILYIYFAVIRRSCTGSRN
ncbi:MAG: hypothetical protein HQM09_12170 [Candidatus Riflebacteria bacterium]|nr:hypothetical protein [Candidatus Riflebacteria bacterium]